MFSSKFIGSGAPNVEAIGGNTERFSHAVGRPFASTVAL